MTQEEAGKKLSDWAKYMEDPKAVPELDQPCTDDEIIEAMKVAGKALTQTNSLEEEIATWIPNHIKGGNDPDLRNTIIRWAGFVARHFAEWGAEHLKK